MKDRAGRKVADQAERSLRKADRTVIGVWKVKKGPNENGNTDRHIGIGSGWGSIFEC